MHELSKCILVALDTLSTELTVNTIYFPGSQARPMRLQLEEGRDKPTMNHAETREQELVNYHFT